jgi:hypothetical protein
LEVREPGPEETEYVAILPKEDHLYGLLRDFACDTEAPIKCLQGFILALDRWGFERLKVDREPLPKRSRFRRIVEE